ncbi:hypothetical protein CBOM_05695 [Ceraceosorus bombacis]|uniref:Uncharacterized protein n=1 Tax=Ceraceosorus bombacis TaxID=401625 RepID=A0A0P1BQV3_9BASI|nr:hypothetical protein CBOM_05695 [Ceraceosorus bombacis]
MLSGKCTRQASSPSFPITNDGSHQNQVCSAAAIRIEDASAFGPPIWIASNEVMDAPCMSRCPKMPRKVIEQSFRSPYRHAAESPLPSY